MSAIDWAYWISHLAWCVFGALVSGVIVTAVAVLGRGPRDYARGWGDGYRTAWALRADMHHEEWMHPEWPVCPDCGRDLFTTEVILPDGSVGCECRLTRQERER